MYIVYFDFSLKKDITFKKLGITIRNIKEKEKDFIINKINNIYKYKKEMNDFYNKNKIYDSKSFDYFKNLNKIKDDKARKYINYAFILLEGGLVFDDLENINKIINKLIVIEVDDSKLDDYNITDIKKFISNIFSLNDICESPLTDKVNINNKDYSFILENNPLDSSEEHYEFNLMLSFILKYSKIEYKTLKEIKTTHGFLFKIEKFLNNLNKSEINKFIEILDLSFCNYSTVQNRIISNVTIVESLIIKEEENIEKAYILKGGLILKKYLEKSSNENIKNMLQFTYNIRSNIVHGNYDKIINDLNKLNLRVKAMNKFIDGLEKTKDKTKEAYNIAYCISDLLSRSTLKYWIENYSEVEYMKNN